MKPSRDNYFKTIEIAEDIAKITGLDTTVVKTVLKSMGIVLAHYVAESCLDESEKSAHALEIPYIGKLEFDVITEKPLTKTIDYRIKLTETFYKYLLDACLNKTSPLESYAAKKFVDVFIDRYKSIV